MAGLSTVTRHFWTSRVREDEAEWHRFADLPGTHARWGPGGLATGDGQVLVAFQPSGQLIVEGRTYERRRNDNPTTNLRKPFDLVDVMTERPIMRIEIIPENRSEFGQIETPSHHYTFPVRGERQRFATMSAVDERDQTAIRYREIPDKRFLDMLRPIEVVISPDQPLSVELCCLLGVTRLFIWLYFNHHYPH